MFELRDQYRSYAADINRFAHWLSGERSEAEDITSGTFFWAWTRSEHIRTETLKVYLFEIVRNTCPERQRNWICHLQTLK